MVNHLIAVTLCCLSVTAIIVTPDVNQESEFIYVVLKWARKRDISRGMDKVRAQNISAGHRVTGVAAYIMVSQHH